MRISYVKIENFRNFQRLEVELGQNLILLGENRAGKSNFIQALRLVLDPSMSEQDRYLSAQDFWDGAEPFQGREIRITVRLTGFADESKPELLPLAWLSHCLTTQVSEPTAQLTYVYFNERNQVESQKSTAEDYEYRIYPGDDSSA
ncbi:MAG: AAA family ATPase [Caldilineaceae bacterium]